MRSSALPVAVAYVATAWLSGQARALVIKRPPLSVAFRKQRGYTVVCSATSEEATSTALAAYYSELSDLWEPVVELFDYRCATIDAMENNDIVTFEMLAKGELLRRPYSSLTTEALLREKWLIVEAKRETVTDFQAAVEAAERDADLLEKARTNPLRLFFILADIESDLDGWGASVPVIALRRGGATGETRWLTAELLDLFDEEIAEKNLLAGRRNARRTIKRMDSSIAEVRQDYGFSDDVSDDEVLDAFLESPLGVWGPALFTFALFVTVFFSNLRWLADELVLGPVFHTNVNDVAGEAWALVASRQADSSLDSAMDIFNNVR